MSTTIATQIRPNDLGVAVALAAIDTAGNKFTPVQNGKPNELLFFNGYSSSISVVLKTQAVAQHAAGLGNVTPADKTLAVAAGSMGIFRIASADLPAYMDVNGLINVTYTGGNVAMVCGLVADA